MFKDGAFVRHTKFGMGAVEKSDANYVHVRFKTDVGTKQFQFQSAEKFLAILDDSAVSAEEIAELNAPPPKPKKTKTDKASCEQCGARLNRSRYSKDGRWKSCPKCSTVHGKQHVYHRCPDDFGESDARETTDNTSGIQSYCDLCRRDEGPVLDGPHTKLCTSLESQAKQP